MKSQQFILAVLITVILALAGSPARAQPDTFGGGTLQVGKDVAPGTYQAEVPRNSTGCYWARMADLTGDTDAILANATLQPGDLATVTIMPEDVGFQSSRCGTWAPSAQVGPATPVTTIEGGTWIVGEDIKAGTYKSSVPEQSDGCYWARLSDLTGGLNSIKANGLLEPGERATVDISGADAGFTTSGCGTWELVTD